MKRYIYGILNSLLAPTMSAHRILFPTLPLEYRAAHCKQVKKEVDYRWAKLKKLKPKFVKYKLKSDAEILEEFNHLHQFRQKLWYRNLEDVPSISQEDYLVAQEVIAQNSYRNIMAIAFDYNLTDKSYNASTVLIQGYHFIALQEPSEELLEPFFKLLLNHGVSILVRVKAESEYGFFSSTKYWKKRLMTDKEHPRLRIEIKENVADYPVVEPTHIPYFHTNDWRDYKGIEVEELYRLVQKVRTTYHSLKVKGPIACHCAAGVGRTGTFITAFVLADLLDRLHPEQVSIEELVLTLSIQRPYMVGTPAQYLTLHRFVEYYLAHHQKVLNNKSPISNHSK